ncbi:MAG: diguanylate cyclase [Desulfobacteraceae bacterium]|nr:diguanylate cyclase [Desulfobacteraceae bacterium]
MKTCNYNILLIEDNQKDIESFFAVIKKDEKFGDEITLAHNIVQALKYLEAQIFDIVLLDLNLPDSCGLDTFFAVQNKYSHLPIIILSSLKDEEFAVSAVKNGAQDYLYKGDLEADTLIRTFRYAVERKSVETKLKESENRLKKIFESVQAGIIIIDSETLAVTDANPNALKIMEHKDKDEITGSFCYDFFPGCNNKCAMNNGVKEICDSEQVMKKSDGTEAFVLKTMIEIVLDGRRHFLETFIDISERKILEEKLRYQATYDSLTGLYNRRHFMDMLNISLESSRRYNVSVSLALCDVDKFKQINDTHGHQVGDNVLEGFAKIITSELRRGDIAGRYGGDEFCLVFTHSASETGINALERIRIRLREARFKGKGEFFSVSATFGIADYFPNMTESELIMSADHALYEAKQLGRNRIVQYKNGHKALHESAADISEIILLEEKLKSLATQDSLTGLYKKSHLMNMLSVSLESSKRYENPLCLSMCEIDKFRQLSDTYNNQTENQILEDFASILKTELRIGDIAGYYETGRFCILFTFTASEGAKNAVERILRRLENVRFESNGEFFSVTATFGIADLLPDMTENQLIMAADHALHKGKQNPAGLVPDYT